MVLADVHERLVTGEGRCAAPDELTEFGAGDGRLGRAEQDTIVEARFDHFDERCQMHGRQLLTIMGGATKPPSRSRSVADAGELRRTLLDERSHTFLEVGSSEARHHQPLRVTFGRSQPGVELLVHLTLHHRHRGG